MPMSTPRAPTLLARSRRRSARRPTSPCPHATSGTVAELLVDSDIFIDHLRGARELKPGRHLLAYSVITRCELFAARQVDEGQVRLLLSPFRELPITGEVAELAGRLRRTAPIRTPDALVAATALVHGLGLVTRNLRDFEAVPRLRVREQP